MFKFDPGNVAISFMAGQDDKISDFVSYRCKYFQYFSKNLQFGAGNQHRHKFKPNQHLKIAAFWAR